MPSQFSKPTKFISFLVLLLGGFLLSSCSDDHAKGMIPKDSLVPDASKFGSACSVAGMHPPREGVLKTGGTAYHAGCNYQNPSLILYVSHYPDPEVCSERYEMQRKKAKWPGKSDLLEERGIPGFVEGRDEHEECSFQFGNVFVSMRKYPQKQRDQLIAAILEHFESVAE